MKTAYGVPIAEVVDDPEWQRVRRGLLGRWKREPGRCLQELRAYLGPMRCRWRVARTLNYLTGSMFRAGMVKHRGVARLRQEVSRRYRELA